MTQDYIELNFSSFRGFGASYIKPTATNSISRIPNLVLAFSTYVGKNANVENDGTKSSINLHILEKLLEISRESKKKNSDDTQTEILEEEESEESQMTEIPYNEEPSDDEDENVIISRSYSFLTENQKCEKGGQEFVAGFIAKKMASYDILRSSNVDETSWMSYLSRSLVCPSDKWFSKFKEFEENFLTFMNNEGSLVHNIYISTKPNIVKDLTLFISEIHPMVPDEIIKCYSKTRVIMRVKYINFKMREQNLKGQLLRFQNKHNDQPATLDSEAATLEGNEDDFVQDYTTLEYKESSCTRGGDNIYCNFHHDL